MVTGLRVLVVIFGWTIVTMMSHTPLLAATVGDTSTPDVGTTSTTPRTETAPATPDVGTTPTTPRTETAPVTPDVGTTTGRTRVTSGLRTARTNWNSLSGKAKLFKGLAVLGGGLMVYEGTTGNGPHSWADVLSGVIGGATTGGTIGGIAGGIGALVGGAIGVVGGGAIGGAKFFSESGDDCLFDPVLLGGGVVYTCCNTVFNEGMRWVGPGGMMFCELSDGGPGVRTCLNGGSTTTDSPWAQDEWGECQAVDNMWCPGVTVPDSDEGVVYVPTLDGLQQKIAQKNKSKIQGQANDTMSEEDLKNVKICWDWVCDEENGYSKSGNACVQGQEWVDAAADPSGLAGQYAELIRIVQRHRDYLIQQCGRGTR